MRNEAPTERPAAGEAAELERLRATADALRARVAALEADRRGELPLAELVSRVWREGRRETGAG